MSLCEIIAVFKKKKKNFLSLGCFQINLNIFIQYHSDFLLYLWMPLLMLNKMLDRTSGALSTINQYVDSWELSNLFHLEATLHYPLV